MKYEILEIKSMDGKYSLVLKVDSQEKKLTHEQIRDLMRIIGRAVDRIRNIV